MAVDGVPLERLTARLKRLLPNIAIPLPSVAGGAVVYFYFNYVDPTAPTLGNPVRDLIVFAVLTAWLTATMLWFGLRLFSPIYGWLDDIAAGADPAGVPPELRRRALNGPWFNAALSVAAWLVAGLFYFPYQVWVSGFSPAQAWRVFAGIVFVGAPIGSALSFLVAEFYWRRRIPVLIPDGRLGRDGIVRVPILARLAATFFITSVLPPMLMLTVTLSLVARFGGELPAEIRPLWMQLLRTQVYILGATGLVSVAMALLVARFINRPVQALRGAMARVAAGDLAVRVPVRSADELGELNQHFNDMVGELRRAGRLRELFGRYVSPAVARQAVERGIALGGELTRATAMFVDLRGFTALTQRASAARVVELLNEYYAVVERVCEREGGVITQFLGDGVVVVFGGPLRPLPDHARRAIAAAVALQRALAERNATASERLLAGIGICTGDMIAGNVGTGGRVTYTIVGDAVNQAARLQVKTRDLGHRILVTASTRSALGEPDGVVLRPCGALPLKGIAAPVEVYAVDA